MNKICPVAARLSYFIICGGAEDLLFLDALCRPFTKESFAKRITDILKEAGYATDQFTDHSFRIGAMKTAA